MEMPSPATIILGVPVWGLTCEQFVDLAVQSIREGRRTLFTTTNAHSIVMANGMPDFMAHFSHADAVLPDGILPVWAGRLAGAAIAQRVTGPDFTDLFLARAADQGLSVFFMGSSEDTLEKIVASCAKTHPALRIAGTLSPPFREFTADDNAHIVDAINNSGTDALLVGMTAPKQEIWLSKVFPSLTAPFAMGIGAAFDFLAGNKTRAPRCLGDAGLEWAFRLAQEPRRLFGRNLNSPRFVWMFVKEQVRRRLSC